MQAMPRLMRWIAFIGFVALWGCSKPANPAIHERPADVDAAKDDPAKPALGFSEKRLRSTPALVRLHKPFREAVNVEPPDGENRPPDKTFAGKNVAAIYEKIVGKDGVGGVWDSVVFVSAEGKPLHSVAHVKTDLGTIQIELLSDLAPNHVRNFIALARSGYFDGLPFHRSIRRELNGKTLAYLESGCPLGTGESGYGSIGYWLRPEVSALSHEEGTVGAFHAEELETASCRFYITLGKAPWMDPPTSQYTIFGKVVSGLDVAHTINKQSVSEDDAPRELVLIREVTITQD
ncbi:MAG: peptidylprolyl isomerase [Planctomycetes bacterium]|nr:peptidylprolyl isomerase [Planctomycetota bacterium]